MMTRIIFLHILAAVCLSGSAVYAKNINNNSCLSNKSRYTRLVCQDKQLYQLDLQMKEKLLSAQLTSNAPLHLINITQRHWQHFTDRCRQKNCIKAQLEHRIDELNIFILLNQTLTQHYIRYTAQQPAQPFTQLHIHQMDKNRVKIEAVQYVDPNRHGNAKYQYLYSYTTADHLKNITDLESDCRYSIQRAQHTLKLTVHQGRCKNFAGIYKLYD